MNKIKTPLITLTILIALLITLFLHKKEAAYIHEEDLTTWPCVNIIEGRIEEMGYTAFNSCTGEETEVKPAINSNEFIACENKQSCLIELVSKDIDEESMKPVFFEPQEIGDRGIFVFLLQLLLNDLGYYQAPVHGYFDIETQKTLSKYQKGDYILRMGSKKGTLDYLTWNESRSKIKAILENR